MLQQTQVDRVIPKYKDFLKKFPTVRTLAQAPLVDVLKVWSGLGYNRRGKYLHDAAKIIVEEHSGQVPREYAALRALPGIGDYTAKAVRVFAWNEPDVLVETNIRTALIHHFYKDRYFVDDKEILSLLRKVGEGQNSRKWHWALMDYGAQLKRSGVRNNARSAHYTKQSKFEGSFRQMRGKILRTLTNGGKEMKGKKWESALTSLARDALVVRKKGRWRIAS